MTPGTDGFTPHVLVVDDTPANCELVRATLEPEGMRVSVAARGEDGVRAFQAEQLDCILMDVRMPDISGFEACKRIRSLPGGRSVPIVFLTALRDVETFDLALAAGADDFLTKPVRPTELLIRVQTALKLRRLGSEVGSLYEGIRQQRDDLMRLQLQKDRLTAFLVHDFKNPVNSMELRAQLLLRHRDLPSDVRAGVLQIRSDVRHLMRLILNVLDVSKGEEAALRPTPVRLELGGLVTRVFETLEMTANDAGVTLESQVREFTVTADPDLLERVLENLIENAVRHAPRDSLVSVEATHGDQRVEIRIRDRGRGVPAEIAERLFDAFIQAEPDSEASRGSRTGRGLGLAFCKVAVHAHGGEIWVENADPGAAFCVRLPHD
ncbi:MAG TPA: hybrid sensor histidine kinase/response regulator [Polyangiaceae bacterium]|nr:hybrid sensor histidine kinase/response regulator [Polyangiaceae bacterium]